MSTLCTSKPWTLMTGGKEYHSICKAILFKYHRKIPQTASSQWQQRFTYTNGDNIGENKKRKKGSENSNEGQDGNTYTNTQVPLFRGHIPTSLLQKGTF